MDLLAEFRDHLCQQLVRRVLERDSASTCG